MSPCFSPPSEGATAEHSGASWPLRLKIMLGRTEKLISTSLVGKICLVFIWAECCIRQLSLEKSLAVF